jgi:hypothetical protein
VSAGPETTAVRLDGRVPLEEVGQGDLLVVEDLLALRVSTNKVESLTVSDHAGLDRRGRGDAVARTRRRCRRRRGRTADNPDASMGVFLKAAAVGLDGRVPLEEVREADLLVVEDLLALCVTTDKVEQVAVGDHARLDRRGGRHAVAGRRRCFCCCGWRRGGGAADDPNAGMGVLLETADKAI